MLTTYPFAAFLISDFNGMIPSWDEWTRMDGRELLHLHICFLLFYTLHDTTAAFCCAMKSKSQA